MAVMLVGEKYNTVRRTIKNNNIFLVTDENGNMLSGTTSGYGLYLGDTRFLSRLECRINDTYPVVLSSSTETGYSSVVIGTNMRIKDNFNPEKLIQQETIQIKRDSVLFGAYFETITLANYNLFEVTIKLELLFEADFMDIFEVRNLKSLNKTNIQKPKIEVDTLLFQYTDITGALQETEISFDLVKPNSIEEGKVTYEVTLPPSFKKEIKYKVNLKSTALLPEKTTASDFIEAFALNTKAVNEWHNLISTFQTDNEDFREMIQRSQKDLNMLTTKAVWGEYISAGIPWFTTLFGRDSIIAGRQSLILTPTLAKNVLITLAKFQGKEVDEWREEEPGKILHEVRFGELARSNQIPHTPYYGSVDATPLWIILLYEYFKWTNDVETLEKLWPTALACLDWMDNYALYNGFAAYIKKSKEGLVNQAWKDSSDSYMHADGSLAEPPIASVEVQGYFYAAKVKMARLATYMRDNKLSARLVSEAASFKQRFHRAFWVDNMNFYALALDKNGDPLRVFSSNVGHLLETGILEPYYEQKIAERLFQYDMFSGWGIRTLSYNSVAYNPMSYHNGSIWPHDNSIIANGLSRGGYSDQVIKISTSLFEAARLMYYKRLPELFCGFTRQYEIPNPPVSYPVACIPQAWSAGTVFFLIKSMLNIEPDAQAKKLRILNPQLPDWLNFLEIKNITVGDASVGIEFRKTSRGLVIDVFDKKGTLDIIIRK
ncbi:MAG: hypothetical protein A2Y25_05750 [Candidatus Melainabacteria bacterium GWF2_37_15]|nr:MAG: hypothetical protein A2Y25_05750 [Candidatus Melainabacteria bacterium GWF2_37_15]